MSIPRIPLEVKIKVIKGNTPEIQAVKVQVQNESGWESGKTPRAPWLTREDASKTFFLWPESLFESDFYYRYGIESSADNESWTEWQKQTGGELVIDVEDAFYFEKTIQTTLAGPFSERKSPIPNSKEGEIIFAEVHLSVPHSTVSQSTSFTFDADNEGAAFNWSIRGRKGYEEYEYNVHMLSLDGRLLRFGPFKSSSKQLDLEITRKV